MQNEQIEGPSTVWVIGTIVAGVLSGFGLIFGLEYLSDRLNIKQSFRFHPEMITKTAELNQV